MAEPTTFGDRYNARQLIGRGGMAKVFLGLDSRLHRPIAIKILLGEYTTNPDFARRFEREARTAARITNPHVVQVFDYGMEGDRPYIVMEFVRGKTLKDLLADKGRPRPARAAEVMADVASALESAHDQGVVHRDVKPANIMIDTEGTVKVADFGIARQRDDDTQLTQAGTVLGTAAYISPEQARGEQADARSDVYSMGVVLWELLVGHPPFQADTSWALAYQHANEAVPLPSSAAADVPADVEAITMRAVQKDPNSRYQTARDLGEDLRRFLRGQRPAAAAPVAPTEAMAGAPAGAAAATAAAIARAQAGATQRRTAVLPQTTAAAPPRKRRVWPAVLGVLLLVAAVGIGTFLVARALTRDGDEPTTTITTSATTTPPTTAEVPETTGASPAPSPSATPTPTPTPSSTPGP